MVLRFRRSFYCGYLTSFFMCSFWCCTRPDFLKTPTWHHHRHLRHAMYAWTCSLIRATSSTLSSSLVWLVHHRSLEHSGDDDDDTSSSSSFIKLYAGIIMFPVQGSGSACYIFSHFLGSLSVGLEAKS